MNPTLVQHEEHPHNPSAVAVFAYFEGTPTAADLLKVQEEEEKCEGWTPPGRELEYLEPVRDQNVVADRAGLERWCLWD